MSVMDASVYEVIDLTADDTVIDLTNSQTEEKIHCPPETTLTGKKRSRESDTEQNSDVEECTATHKSKRQKIDPLREKCGHVLSLKGFHGVTDSEIPEDVKAELTTKLQEMLPSCLNASDFHELAVCIAEEPINGMGPNDKSSHVCQKLICKLNEDVKKFSVDQKHKIWNAIEAAAKTLADINKDLQVLHSMNMDLYLDYRRYAMYRPSWYRVWEEAAKVKWYLYQSINSDIIQRINFVCALVVTRLSYLSNLYMY